MLIQCTPLLVEKAGVTPEVNLRNPLCTGEEARKQGNPPWLWNPGQTSPEVQNRGISGPTKRTCTLEKLKKKKSSCMTCTEAYCLQHILSMCCVLSVGGGLPLSWSSPSGDLGPEAGVLPSLRIDTYLWKRNPVHMAYVTWTHFCNV